MAENISTCTGDMVPIQITYGTAYNDVTTLSAATARIRDFPPGFPAFVTAVTEHVATKLAQENICLDSIKNQDDSLLQFVPLPICISSEAPPMASILPLEAQHSGGCRISSPWIDLVIERSPVPAVRGVVRYSERQLLADQAVLAGASDVPPGVVRPLKPSEFTHYVFEYERSEFHGPRPTEKSIEERVPPDILWLFRRARQSTRGPFGGAVGDSMINAMKTGSEGYTKIVIALIDRCLEYDGADIQYSGIFDINDPILFEQYKIIAPIH